MPSHAAVSNHDGFVLDKHNCDDAKDRASADLAMIKSEMRSHKLADDGSEWLEGDDLL
jgi:hypothetical protein